jgi:formate dehydrogenase major subunit
MENTAYINDVAYTTKPGETILSFVRRHLGKDFVPTLCDAPNLEPFGSCRVCSVDVALVKDGPAKVQAFLPHAIDEWFLHLHRQCTRDAFTEEYH